MRLSDSIEEFIKSMLLDEDRFVELQRRELADYFNCAPSQISYVLATRFTPDRGYIIESQRGGGGCIRLFRIQQDTREAFFSQLYQRVGTSVDALTASRLIQQMRERDIITDTEAALMASATSQRALSLPMTDEMKNSLRARIFQEMLTDIARKPMDHGGNENAL